MAKNKGGSITNITMPSRDDLDFQRLSGCGADINQLSLAKPFKLEEALKDFTSAGKGMTPLRVTGKEQVKDFKMIMQNPLASAYTMCIAGQASDLRCKLIAAKIALRALEIEPEAYHNIWWHHLTGSYRDRLRDFDYASHKKPKLIILTNFPVSTDTSEHATQQKIEKCRDLMELYSNVPRILVSCGMDPVQLFSQKLMYPLNTKMYLTSTRHVGIS
ncbi:hypothetical protein GR11A_00003 [Vibrio phage vB_VcorM_GR11A]|nr:hypothetical protein GR11A_00003 [Vibrio phage vB_VcorM_GR11A]